MNDKSAQKKIKFFECTILSFYNKSGRKHLPWRKKRMTAYEVWVSEIMLQQTQVDRVIDFYRRFIKRYPTVIHLAETTWEEFLPYYQGLGYYNRGRNMLKTAQEVVRRYNGRFPREIEELQKLPGIGEYTARAIVSFAHGHDHMAWDTNFYRVFGRFFYGTKDAEIDKRLFEENIRANKRDFNGAIMDFGSLVCTKKPKCDVCPVSSYCQYFLQKGSKELTQKPKNDKFPMKKTVAIVVLHKDHKIYFSSRKSKYQPFMLPAGKTSRDEIKQYFKNKYELDISVRPPHKKVYISRKPIIFLYAQVLLGKHSFVEFTKTQVGDIMKNQL